jgi:hypothetical protein
MVRIWKQLILSAAALTFFASLTTVQSAEYPKPGASCATLAAKGVWTWYNDPRAVYFKGTKEKTYVGYTNTATTGATAIASYDHATGLIATFDLHTAYGLDDHNNTSVFVRNDGRIMTFYSKHYGPDIRMRISTNPEDISAFDAEKVVFTGSNTYPNIVQLSDEGTNKNRLYLFFRGPNNLAYDAGQPYFQTSDDGGSTWTAAFRYFNGINGGTFTAGLRPYVKYVSNGKDKIYMLIERDNRNNAPSKPTYIMYYYNNAFYRMNGTMIKTVADAKTNPVTVTDVDVVFDPNNFPDVPGTIVGTGWDIALDSDGYPVFVYDVYDRNGGQNHRLFYFRWDGSKFNHYFLVNSGAPMTEGGAEQGFAGGIILDHANPSSVYLSTHVNGSLELQRWLTPDKGATWKYWEITSGSGANKNTRPIVPRGAPGTKVSVVWNCGTYNSFDNGLNQDVKYFEFDSTKMANGVTSAGPRFERRAPKATGFNLMENGLSFTLLASSSSTLRIYSLQGRIVSDLTSDVRRMQPGSHAMNWNALGIAPGSYVGRLFDGAMSYSQKFIVQR